MAHDLDLGLLRTFLAVADRASMTAAANAVHLTQGAISQQVRRLEELFGTKLFERSRPGLRLTPSGERLLGRARHLVALGDSLWVEMTGTAVNGAVRLGAPYDLAGSRLALALKHYAAACPMVELSLSCASSPELAAALARGELDAALIEERPAGSTGECLSAERLVWAGAAGGTAHLRQPLPVSIVADTCAFRPAVLDALHGTGLAWRTVSDTGSLEATTATVRADLAVSAWLASTVPADLCILGAGSGLPPLPGFAITLYLARGDARPAMTELTRHLRQAFAPAAV